MENKRGSEIFLGVVGVATLLVAIIGATFAYFSATAQSTNEIKVQTTTLSLGYDDVTTRLKTAMIPSAFGIARYAAFDTNWTTGQQVELTDGSKINGKGECIDQNGNQICSVYEFYIGNPSTSTSMNITGRITSVTNEFQNLMFAIYNEAGEQVMGPTLMPESQKSVPFTGELANQELIGYADVAQGANGKTFNDKRPSTYKPVCIKSVDDDCEKTNVRHYTMLIWLNEAGAGNVEEAGKVFTAGISFDTGSGSGVTGVIGVSNDDIGDVVETPKLPAVDDEEEQG